MRASITSPHNQKQRIIHSLSTAQLMTSLCPAGACWCGTPAERTSKMPRQLEYVYAKCAKSTSPKHHQPRSRQPASSRRPASEHLFDAVDQRAPQVTLVDVAAPDAQGLLAHAPRFVCFLVGQTTNFPSSSATSANARGTPPPHARRLTLLLSAFSSGRKQRRELFETMAEVRKRQTRRNTKSSRHRPLLHGLGLLVEVGDGTGMLFADNFPSALPTPARANKNVHISE